MIDPGEFEAMRRLWCAAMMTEFHDRWGELHRKNPDTPAIHRRALNYFRSRDGRLTALCAGIDASPEQLAAVCVDPTARDRIKALEDLQ